MDRFDTMSSSFTTLIAIGFAASFVLPVRECTAAEKRTKEKPPLTRLERKLLDAGKLELFSLSPNYYRFQRTRAYVPGGEFPEEPQEKQGFHDHKILGSVVLKTTEVRRQLAQQLIDNFNEPGGGSECFDPHHGLRIFDNGTTVDLVICFSCGRMNTYGMDDDGENVSNNVPPLFTSLFLESGIQYEGPMPESMKFDDKQSTESRKQLATDAIRIARRSTQLDR